MSLPRLDFRHADVTLPANNPGDIAAAIDSVSTMNEPVFVTLRARDVKPYHYALWSSVGGDPFANCICLVKWSDDGTHLRWMLESHNFYEVEPDEEVEVVDLRDNLAWAIMREKYADWTLPPPPRVTTEPLAPDLGDLEAEIRELRNENRMLTHMVGLAQQDRRTYDHPYRWSSESPACATCGSVHDPLLDRQGAS